MKNAIKFILFAKLLTKTGNPQTDVKPDVQGQITQRGINVLLKNMKGQVMVSYAECIPQNMQISSSNIYFKYIPNSNIHLNLE